MIDTTDWKPSEAMVKAYHDAQQKALRECRDDNCFSDHEVAALIAVRPLMRDEILAEEQPKIEAAERERVLEMAAEAVERLKPIPKTLASIAELEALLNETDPSPVIIQSDGKVVPDYAAVIRALKDSKP